MNFHFNKSVNAFISTWRFHLLAIVIRLLLPITLLLVSISAAAELKYHWQAGIGVTLGGDTLATAVFEDNKTVNIDAGDLLHFWGGAVFPLPDSPYEFAANAGYHFDFARDKDGDAITFSRYPLEAALFYTQGTFRLGAGCSYHIDPKLDRSDINQNSVTYKNAFGYYFQGGGFIAKQLWIDVRYLAINYQAKSVPSIARDVDGSHFGIYLTLPF